MSSLSWDSFFAGSCFLPMTITTDDPVTAMAYGRGGVVPTTATEARVMAIKTAIATSLLSTQTQTGSVNWVRSSGSVIVDMCKAASLAGLTKFLEGINDYGLGVGTNRQRFTDAITRDMELKAPNTNSDLQTWVKSTLQSNTDSADAVWLNRMTIGIVNVVLQPFFMSHAIDRMVSNSPTFKAQVQAKDLLASWIKVQINDFASNVNLFNTNSPDQVTQANNLRTLANVFELHVIDPIGRTTKEAQYEATARQSKTAKDSVQLLLERNARLSARLERTRQYVLRDKHLDRDVLRSVLVFSSWVLALVLAIVAGVLITLVGEPQELYLYAIFVASVIVAALLADFLSRWIRV